MSAIECYKFLVWLRTGSNLTDINRFRSHTGKICSSNEIQTFTKQGLKHPQIAKIYKSLIDKRTNVKKRKRNTMNKELFRNIHINIA